jgi:hypothetical protein
MRRSQFWKKLAAEAESTEINFWPTESQNSLFVSEADNQSADRDLSIGVTTFFKQKTRLVSTNDATYGRQVTMAKYLAAKDEDQQQGGGQLSVREHDDVHQIRIGWRLQEQPDWSQHSK